GGRKRWRPAILHAWPRVVRSAACRAETVAGGFGGRSAACRAETVAGGFGNPARVPVMIAADGRAITAGQMYGYGGRAAMPGLRGWFFVLVAVVYVYVCPSF